MAESEKQKQASEMSDKRLVSAIERARIAQASRDDVVVEMKQTAMARLELLAQDLKPVFNSVPGDNDQFEFALTDGEIPRLWIDMTSHVRMDRERRGYEFVKDTRNGRILLAESTEREVMANAVTGYIAERILEREQIIAGDWHPLWDRRRQETTIRQQRKSGYRFVAGLLIGALIGAVAMIVWAWFGSAPL